jgi:hypothetical protein
MATMTTTTPTIHGHFFPDFFGPVSPRLVVLKRVPPSGDFSKGFAVSVIKVFSLITPLEICRVSIALGYSCARLIKLRIGASEL